MGTKRQVIAEHCSFALLACLFLSVAPSTAWATPIVDSWVARFEAPPQKAGGLGGYYYPPQIEQVNSGWAKGTGVRLDLWLDLGLVSGNVEGLLAVKHEDVLPAPGSTQVELLFQGIPGESEIKSTVGGGFKITETLKVDFPWYVNALLGGDINYTVTEDFAVDLNTDTDFTYSAGATVEGKGNLDLLSLGADVVLAGLDVDLLLEKSVFFRAEELMGLLIATHLDSGVSRVQSFSGVGNTSSTEISVLLDRPGYWYLTLEDLELEDNAFWQEWGVGIAIEFWVAVLGDVLEIKSIPFHGQTSPVSLYFDYFDPVDLGGGFLIQVVPEPGTGLLLAAGLLALAAKRQSERARG